MLWPPEMYNANLKVSAEILAFHIVTGESRPYNVYEEVETGKELLRCDLCGLFIEEDENDTMYNLNFTRRGDHKNEGFQAYSQCHP